MSATVVHLFPGAARALTAVPDPVPTLDDYLQAVVLDPVEADALDSAQTQLLEARSHVVIAQHVRDLPALKPVLDAIDMAMTEVERLQGPEAAA